MNINDTDRMRALRLILSGLNEDADAAQAVFAEAGYDADGYVKLAMCAADTAAVFMAKTVGVELAATALLSDLYEVLGVPRPDGGDLE
ncbi:hypothetical protein [Rhodococcus jostii]|uniref:hypothetical protein n=1 Tax=Rhodococcus jostii TaxID=132919 RepID=UPI003645DB72